ncbi:MAG: DNA repair protein RecN [bacterium]|nr:DNA repair protein RecN [bacterium]
MLQHLYIHNIGIFETIELDFTEGLNVLTGETGAGKSLIVKSLSLLLGAQSSDDLIATGQDTAVVEGHFTLQSGQTHPLLEGCSHCIVHKKLRRGKPAITRINEESVTLKTLKDIVSPLLQITSQHDAQTLRDAAYHERLYDAFCGPLLHDAMRRYRAEYNAYLGAKRQLDALQNNTQDTAQRLAFLEFQLEDIDSHGFTAEEEENLLSVRHSAKHHHTVVAGLSALSQAIDTAQSELAKTATARSQLAHVSAEQFGEMVNEIDEIVARLSDLEGDASTILGRYENADELDIDTIESRLDDMFKVRTKYKAPSVEALLAYRNQLQEELDVLARYQTDSSALEKELATATSAARDAAKTLHDARAAKQSPFSTQICESLGELGFVHPQFRVQIDETDVLGPTGTDAITFLFSANPGDTPKPLHKVASGGEMSRVLLALKEIESENAAAASLVFDEVDTGVGGLTANAIGAMLKRISKHNQLITITHLPQIAKLADSHFFIEKHQSATHTTVSIRVLATHETAPELQRMVGGKDTVEYLL